jgi:hypothetical protein
MMEAFDLYYPNYNMIMIKTNVDFVIVSRS